MARRSTYQSKLISRKGKIFSGLIAVVIPLVGSLAFSFFVSTITPAALAEDNFSQTPEVPDAASVHAYRQFWNAFEMYERRLLKEGQREFQESWRELQKSHDLAEQKLTQQQIATLQQAARNYKQHIDDHPIANNRPYVMLNLAQILNILGDQLMPTDEAAAKFSKTEGLAYLRDIEERFLEFEHREDAMYLRATILESLGRGSESSQVWRTLARNGHRTIYAVHANLVVGDAAFDRGEAKQALAAYETAGKLLPLVSAQDSDYEKLRIEYRIAWAAYKSAELKKVLKSAAHILQPGSAIKSAEQRQKMQQDAIELIGDALYEGNSLITVRDTLREKAFLQFGPAIGLRVLQRQKNNGLHAELTKTGEFIADEFPTAKEAPEILNLIAGGYESQKNRHHQIETLEKIALLLPTESLWRSKNLTNPTSIRLMEDRAVAAARAVAAFHYEIGLASGNLKSFSTSESFYEILLDHANSAPEANTWRLRIANCFYFVGSLDEASSRYSDLKTKYQVDRTTLEVASYQLVLTNEKRWRSQFEQSLARSDDPVASDETKQALDQLEKSIDEFANKFPNESRAVDLLLVGASTNRDQERYDNASRFWQRALVSNPNPSQRAIAIRGLVFANMKNGSPADVIAQAGKFLKLENWQALGLTLGTELKGVLSSATLDEGARLNKDGKVFEAGSMMVAIAQEYKDIPQREKIYRDGAYMIAIAGYWAEAQKAADDYIKDDLQRNRADMKYLLARSHEFQIRLRDAARAYLDVGSQYPRHPRAMSSLDRAEKLAAAEGDYTTASQAAALIGERAPSSEDRLAALNRAIDYASKTDSTASAVKLAKQRLDSSKSNSEKYGSQILLAKATYADGRERQAIDDLEIIAKRLDQQRGQLGPAYARLAGEANYLLGEEARRKFDDFQIFERSGSIQDKISQKTKFFEELVMRYDKSANAGEPQFATHSRFRLAEAAESFATEISSIPARKDESVTLKSASRYNETIKRMRDMAQKYYTNNILAERQDPSRYRNNEWVKRSSIKLSAYGDKSYQSKLDDHPPEAIQMELPYTYNL